jgi:Tol biopolymer transport system component
MGVVRFFALTAIIAVGVVPSKAHQRLVYSNFGTIEVYDTLTGRSTVIFRGAAPQYEGGGNPRWSPDGKQIALAGAGTELVSIRSDGTALQPLVEGTTVPAGWSSDGRWIAYQTFLPDARSDLRIIRKDGTRMHRISTASSLHPVWIPGTHRMVVGRGLDMTIGTWSGFVHEIVIVGAGAKLVVVPHSRDGDGPAVSRNGRWIAFTKNDRIYVERFNGTGFHVLTAASKKYADSEPAWSPDGKRLSFTRTHFVSRNPFDYHEGIMVVDVDGGGLRPVEDQDGANSASSWSPDGRFISFKRSTSEKGDELLVVDLRTGHARTVGFFDGNDERPDWAPLG